MSRSNKRIAVTIGDPGGIGPEVTFKALMGRDMAGQRRRFIVVGRHKIFKRLAGDIQIVDVSYKTPGEGALKFLNKAVELIKTEAACGMVTAPLSKEAVNRHHHGFVGHTEYLAQAFGVKHFDMMFIAGPVRLSIVTRHVPIKDVPRLITPQAVFNSITLMSDVLKEKFKIKTPRIAVLGLNPHAGEGGILGFEDAKSILPAVKKARGRGIKAAGPLPADTFFAFSSHGKNIYDGIIAMYHDQGLAPIKGLYMKDLVNFTAGLPFIRTSPAHGTAFDIAGKNKADPSSMLAALKLACQLT